MLKGNFIVAAIMRHQAQAGGHRSTSTAAADGDPVRVDAENVGALIQPAQCRIGIVHWSREWRFGGEAIIDR